MSRYLDPKNDLVFKKVFGEHPHLLKSFLNAVLPLPVDRQIEELAYLPTEQVPVIPVLKRPIVDVKCRDSRGDIFIVEMQMEWTDSFKQRLLFNAASAYVRQLNKGEGYILLSPVYGLALVNQNFDPDLTQWYHHYNMVKVGDAEKIIEGLTLVFVELQKFPVKTNNEKRLKILWLRFLRELSDRTSVVSEELLAVPEISEAIALTEESGFTIAELEEYDRYWDNISTQKTLLMGRFDEGKAEGLTEGEAKGRAEEGVEIAKRMMQNGLSIEQITFLTGISRQTIESWLEF